MAEMPNSPSVTSMGGSEFNEFHWRQKYEMKCEEYRQLLASNTDLKAKLASSEAELQELKRTDDQKLDDMERKYRASVSQVEDLFEKLAAAQEQNVLISEDLADLEENEQQHEMKEHRLKAELRSVKSDLHVVKRRISATGSESENKQDLPNDEFELLKRKFIQLEQSKDDIERQHRITKARCQELEEKIAAMSETTAFLQDELEEAKDSSMEDQIRLKQELQDMKQELNVATRRLSIGAPVPPERSLSAADRYEASNSEIKEVKEQLAKMMEETRRLEQEKDDWERARRVQLEQVRDLHERLAAAEENNVLLKAEMEESSQETVDYQQRLQEELRDVKQGLAVLSRRSVAS